MLTLTRKEYEIEEDILVNDSAGNEIIRFKMQITPDELDEIRLLIFNVNDEKNGKLLSKYELNKDVEKYEELETKVIEETLKRQERLEEICFKEHREEFKKKAGNYIYNEMVEKLFDFFIETFVNKRVKLINTTNTHLKKITNR